MTSRRGLRAAWIGALALGYGAFFVWYGGSGRPLTAEEGRAYLERIRTTLAATEHPDLQSGLEDLIARDDGREFFMVNLESVKTGPEAAEADAAYGRAVLPALLKRASFPIYIGRVRARLLGSDPMGVNRVIVVRYRSLRDFLDIFSDPAMSEGVSHKFAALSNTDVRATTPFLSIAPIRLTAALGLLLVGAVGWIGLGRGRRREKLALER